MGRGITCLWTEEGRLYLATMIDVYSRAVIGWSMASEMTGEPACSALRMALTARGNPSGVIVHERRAGRRAAQPQSCIVTPFGDRMQLAPALLVLLSAIAPPSAASETTSHPDAAQPIFDRMEGTWDVVSSAEPCSKGATVHTIRFNAARTVAMFENRNPWTRPDGTRVRGYSYTVISATPTSITMHLVGEERRLPTGDDYIWVMEEVEPGVYSWRLYGFELRSPQSATFRKCAESPD